MATDCTYNNCEWYKALYDLTVGGSEFTNEPQACEAYVRRKLSGLHEARKEIVRLRRELESAHKRGVVDGMTASANFVAAAHLQGRDNDRMRLADSLRSEAKRVEQEK